jgi:hypothetical protein
MSDQTILFVSVFNAGGLEMALNHIESLKRAQITHYMTYVTDPTTYEYLSTHGHPTTLIEGTVGGEDKLNFDSTEFNELSYLRYKIIYDLLVKGVTVWYMDIDTVVLNSIRCSDRINNMLKNCIDITFQDDINMLCTGCMLITPNERTIEFTRITYDNRRSDCNDQLVANRVIRQMTTTLKVDVFSRLEFPNGLVYFIDPTTITNPIYRAAQEQFKAYTGPVSFVHANWMIGLDTKILALQSKGLWYLDTVQT